MKNYHLFGKTINGKYYPLLLFFVSFVFVTLFSRSTSFLYVFEGADPAIFKQMGLALLKGKTLYVDYFDNKGCILYFIQAIGLRFGGNFCILLMQALSLTVTLVIWDKLLSLFCTRRHRIISLGILLFLLMCFYEGGDLTEEWCLPFASYPLLLYFQALKNGKEFRPIEMFCIGLCFGIIAFIRVNNAVSFLGFVVYLFIVWLLNKDFKKLFKNLTFFLLGTFFITFGCTLYFYLKAGWNGVNEMYYATFLSNFEYIASKSKPSLFLNYLPFLSFLSLFAVLLYINTVKQKDLFYPTLLSFLFFVCSFGFRCFSHYLMSLLPLCVIILINFRLKHQTANIILSIAFLLPLSIYTLRPIGFLVNDILLGREKFPVIYSNFHHCIEDIPENERDSICNYNLLGHGYGLMMHEKLLQSNRICISNTSVNMPTLWKKTSDKVKNPKWILLSWDYYFTNEDAWYIVDNYDLYCEFRYNRIYLEKPRIGQDFQVYLYRRKD